MMPSEPVNPENMSVDDFVRHGFALQGRGNHQEAAACFSSALESIERSDALGGLAFSYRSMGLFTEALNTYQRILDIDASIAEVHFEIGTLLMDKGLLEQAISFLRTAVHLKPDYLPTYLYLAYAMLRQCSWENIDGVIARALECVASDVPELQRQIPQFALLALPLDMQTRLKVSRSLSADAALRTSSFDMSAALSVVRPLKRIGYLSPDFRSHSVGLAFRDILRNHDFGKYEFFGYSVAATPPDALTLSLQKGFSAWRDLAGSSHLEVAQAIRADDIDILIDLAGHTKGSRFEALALRPARIQAHFLGYGFTTGADSIDYLITDPTTTPEASHADCSEALVLLPHHSLPAASTNRSQAEGDRARHGLPPSGFVFADFNSHHKIESRVFGAWMRILRQVEESVLWLMDGTDTTRKNLRAEAKIRGVDPARILFAERLPHEDHAVRLGLVDLALDTFVHAGGVTTTDALCTGLPVLVMQDKATLDTTGISLVRAAGLPELMTNSESSYIRRAVDLARNPGELSSIRNKLEEAIDRPAPLFDNYRLTRDLEKSFEQMWSCYQSQTPPKNIVITDEIADV
jgi:protein O-GlcNAc transferase